MSQTSASAALVTLTIDEERGRAPHSAAKTALEVLLHALQVGMVGHVLTEALCVQPDLGGVPGQVFVLQGVLVLEQQVMHRPKAILALCRGALSRLGSVAGMRMLRPREVPVHEAELVTEPLSNALEIGVGHAAERALEVAVLDQGDGGVRRPQGVVPPGDGDCQAGCL